MWGGGDVDAVQYDASNLTTKIHMPWIATNADDQIGRLITKLRQLGQRKETLFVVLADHGVTYGDNFYGQDYASGAYDSW